MRRIHPFLGYSVLAIVSFAVFMAISHSLKENMLNTECQTNLRTLGRGVLIYAEDYDGAFPDMRFWMPANRTKFPGCPKWHKFTPPADRPTFHVDDMPIGGYAPNPYFCYDDGLSMRQIMYPQRAILIYEADENDPEGASERHMGKSNYFFVDGHVELDFHADVRHLDHGDTNNEDHIRPSKTMPSFYVQ